MNAVESLPLCIWEGPTLPITSISCLHSLQALCLSLTRCGNDTLHNAVRVVSGAFRHNSDISVDDYSLQ